MEAVSAGEMMRGENNPLWWESVTNITEIMLYPATRLSQLSQEHGCHIPNAQDWANWANVTSNINQQLENWSIPFRFNISTEAAKLDERALNSSDNQCFTVNIRVVDHYPPSSGIATSLS